MQNVLNNKLDIRPGLALAVIRLKRKIKKSSHREPLYLLGLNESKRILQDILKCGKK